MILKRPGVRYDDLLSITDLNGEGPLAVGSAACRAVLEQVEIQAKYHGYISRQQTEVQRSAGQEKTEIPEDMDYTKVRGLSTEACQKLQSIRPQSLGQAGRISGMTPAAISLLWVHLKRLRAGQRPEAKEQAV